MNKVYRPHILIFIQVYVSIHILKLANVRKLFPWTHTFASVHMIYINRLKKNLEITIVFKRDYFLKQNLVLLNKTTAETSTQLYPDHFRR